MKIAFVGQRGVPATFGGVERHVEEIGARLAAAGHDVTVFCRSSYGDDRRDSYRGMRLVHLRAPNSKHFEAILHSGRAALATIGRRYDIVHYHAVGPGLVAPLSKMFSGAKVVQTIHGLDADRAKWGKGASAVLQLATWMSARVPDATVVVSHELADVYQRRFCRETVQIENGAPAVTTRPASTISTRWGLTPGEYVLFVGRLVPEKAPELLVDAFRDVPGEDVRLVIAGGPSHTPQYVERLRKMAAEDPRVLLTGYVYGDELAELYSNAAVFVLPSLLEGMPLTLLEAASYGCSIIASDIPPHVEVLETSRPGARLVRTGDRRALTAALTEALEGDPVTESEGAKALCEHVKESYSWDRAAEHTEALYESLLASPTRRAGCA